MDRLHKTNHRSQIYTLREIKMFEEEIDIINDILKILGKSNRIECQDDTSNKISYLNKIFEHLNILKENGINLKIAELYTICWENLNDLEIKML